MDTQRPSDHEYDWPCWKTGAHGPHEIIDGLCEVAGEPRICPGVKAHPNTMIGRNDVRLISGEFR